MRWPSAHPTLNSLVSNAGLLCPSSTVTLTWYQPVSQVGSIVYTAEGQKAQQSGESSFTSYMSSRGAHSKSSGEKPSGKFAVPKTELRLALGKCPGRKLGEQADGWIWASRDFFDIWKWPLITFLGPRLRTTVTHFSIEKSCYNFRIGKKDIWEIVNHS